MHTYIHTHTYIHAYVHAHIHIHTNRPVYMYICMCCMYMHTPTCIVVYASIHKQINKQINKKIYIWAGAYPPCIL